MGVVELDPADAFASEQHPETEEGHEHGHARPSGDGGGGDRGEQDRADDEDQRSGLHWPE